MRCIDCLYLVLPDGWKGRAQAAAKAVANGADPNDYAAVWRELKNGLADLLHDKCWYCESPVERSDNAVDHFRPKNRVSDAANHHDGYRWLAFERSNFRYACTFCNSLRKDLDDGTVGGKADRFPLLNEHARLYAPGPLKQERPALLDPCELSDWELLGCKQENGHPCAATQDPVAVQRVETSIKIYHLHYEPTCKHRHRVAVQLLADVQQGKRLFDLLNKYPDLEEEFDHVAMKIRRAIDRKAPFSGEMIFLLRGERHTDHPWIQKILDS